MLALICLLLRRPLEVGDWLYFTPVPGYRQLASWTQATCLSLTFPRRQVGWRRGGILGLTTPRPWSTVVTPQRGHTSQGTDVPRSRLWRQCPPSGSHPTGCSLFAYLEAGGCPVCQELLVTSAQWLVPGAQ